MKLWLMASWLRHLFLTRKLKGLFRPMMYLRGGKTCQKAKLACQGSFEEKRPALLESQVSLIGVLCWIVVC